MGFVLLTDDDVCPYSITDACDESSMYSYDCVFLTDKDIVALII
jgi:hypothetical protein